MLSEMLVKHFNSPKMLFGTLVKPYDSTKTFIFVKEKASPGANHFS